MKECKNCGRTEVRFYSKRHLTCIDCLRLPEKKKKPTKDFKYMVRKRREDCSRFIFSKRNDSDYNVYLGCTYKKIREHIEKQFITGMSWQSHGGWHIDHIIPLSKARNEIELNNLLRWQNIRPLWAEANLRKKDGKIDNSKLKEINEKMALRYEIAQNNFASGIIKTKTTKEIHELLKDFGIVTMNELIIYARSIGYEREGDLFIKRRKI
jgi:5-methylcytosine-specific restriction endonuclease McrA